MIDLTEILSDNFDIDLYHYYNGLNNRTLFIKDDITSEVVQEIAIPLLEMDRVSDQPITIYINTTGGEIYSGFNLASIIERLRSPTTIIAMGYALSMGTYILMAGYNKENITRKCYSFSIGLIHGGSMALEGSLSQVKDTYNFSVKYENKIKDFVLSHSNFSEEEYEKIERTELYLTAEDMLEKGLIDEII